MYAINIHKDLENKLYIGECDYPAVLVQGETEEEIKNKMVDAIIGFYEAFPEDLINQFKITKLFN